MCHIMTLYSEMTANLLDSYLKTLKTIIKTIRPILAECLTSKPKQKIIPIKIHTNQLEMTS